MSWDLFRDFIVNPLLFPVQLLIATFLYTFGNKRRSNYIARNAVGILLVLLLNAAVAWLPQSVNLILKFAAVILYVHFCYDIGWGKAFFDSTCAYATQHLAYQLSLVLFFFFPLGAAQEILLQCIIAAAVYAGAYHLFAEEVKNQDNEEILSVSTETIASMAVILLIAVILTTFTDTLPPANTISGLHNTLSEQTIISVLTLNCAFYSIVGCFCVLWIQASNRKQLKLQHELDVQRQLWLAHKNQYELSKENIEIINQKCHDLKHQISALREFYTDEQRRDYLAKIEKSVMIYDSDVKTGNQILDTILTEKTLICEKNQIKLICVADGSCLSFVDPIDLYAMITNALNNAMDYVLKLEDPDQRVISVKVYERVGIAFIQVENHFPGTLEYHGGLPITTKSDKANHGFGLRSIRYTAEKYNGYMNIETQNNMFILRISLPNAQ